MAREIFFRRDQNDGLWREVKNKSEVIKTLPEKGKILAEKMGENLKLTEDAEVLYPGIERPGSPLLLLMKWYLNRKTAVEKPLDAEAFERLIESSVPKRWIRLYKQ